MTNTAKRILRYDDGSSARWLSEGGEWQAVFLHWQPGRVAVHLARDHTPDLCMTAAGHALKSINPQLWLEVKGFHLPFSVNQVTDSPRPVFVFYCLWDDRAIAQGFDTRFLDYGNRLTPVLAGLRNPGQRSMEILVLGPESPEAATEALRSELEKILVRQEEGL